MDKILNCLSSGCQGKKYQWWERTSEKFFVWERSFLPPSSSPVLHLDPRLRKLIVFLGRNTLSSGVHKRLFCYIYLCLSHSLAHPNHRHKCKVSYKSSVVRFLVKKKKAVLFCVYFWIYTSGVMVWSLFWSFLSQCCYKMGLCLHLTFSFLFFWYCLHDYVHQLSLFFFFFLAMVILVTPKKNTAMTNQVIRGGCLA